MMHYVDCRQVVHDVPPIMLHPVNVNKAPEARLDVSKDVVQLSVCKYSSALSPATTHLVPVPPEPGRAESQDLHRLSR